MEIQEIKRNLSIAEVLSHYNLKANKNNLLKCPFHADKTASLQLYPKTNTYNCFSCGANGDTIQFIQDYEKTNKHSALKKASQIINPSGIKLINSSTHQPINSSTNKPINTLTMDEQSKIAVLTKAWNYFNNAIKTSKQAQDYVKKRGLSPFGGNGKGGEIGYNSGQLHHRQSRELVESYAKYHLLSDSGTKGKTETCYSVWAKNCIIFPLRNKQNQVVSLYGRSIYDNAENKHYYMKERSGLYPNYPKPETKTLIIPECIIDTATLIQLKNEEMKELKNYEILASYGTNGLTAEHKEAIKELKELEEIIFFFDGDEAGKAGAEARAIELKEIKPNVKFTYVETPENEDINSLSLGHEPELFTELINNRKQLFSFSIENKKPTKNINEVNISKANISEANINEYQQSEYQQISTEPTTNNKQQTTNLLNCSNSDYITYQTQTLEFALLGGISIKQLDRMRVTLRTSRSPQLSPLHSIRQNLDLYNDDQVEKYIRKTAERLEMGTSQINKPLYELIEKLEKYRLEKRDEQKENFRQPQIKLSEAEKKEAIEKLKQKNLISWLKNQIKETGLVNEENNGLLLFLIFLTRNFKDPLHALVHGLSGSGKTHLLKSIIKLVPPEVVYTTTAITENVLFYPPYKEFWKHKILMLEDLDGSYSALLPLREFMSNQYISKLSTEHDPKTGEFKQRFLEAEGPICIAGATTKDKLYEDNANRSFIIHVDESREHKTAVMEYQNKIEAGLINENKMKNTAIQIQNMQRMLKPIKIINPFAPELKLPDYIFKPLRTNTHYLTLIRSITYLHQYQLPIKKTKNGTEYIETTLEHIAIANELSKELLLRKSDELGGQLRNFFEELKRHCKSQEKQGFFAKEIRIKYRYHPQKLKRYLDDLEHRSYIKKIGGYMHKQGFEYEIIIWDDYQILKDGINILDKILEKLKSKNKGSNHNDSQHFHSTFTNHIVTVNGREAVN